MRCCIFLSFFPYHSKVNEDKYMNQVARTVGPTVQRIRAVLKVVHKEAGSLPQSEIEVPIRRNFFCLKNGELWCILSGILCDLELRIG